MPIPLTCRCGMLYHLKDEYAGVLVQCPTCSFAVQAGFPQLPTLRRAAPARQPSLTDRLAGQHTFVVHSLDQHAGAPAAVYDATGQALLYVDGVDQLRRSRLALLASVGLSLAVALVCIALAAQAGSLLQTLALALLGLGAAAVARASLPGLLAAPPQFCLYADAERQQRVLELLPDGRLGLPRARYRLQDVQGQQLALLQTSLRSALRGTRWACYAPDGRLLWLAVTEPGGEPFWRRLLLLLGRQGGNTFLLDAQEEHLLGALRRSPDSSTELMVELDPEHTGLLDRRLAIVAALLIQTGRP